MAAKRAPSPPQVSIRLCGEPVSLRLDPFLIGAMELERERNTKERRTMTDVIRHALENAFQATGDRLITKIGATATRDRRDRRDVIRIALQDAFQKGTHGPPIYPPRRRA
jgi:hypothetical protein